ncbi:UDP-N-acetylmuramoyl-L-alanyl-D-glutamate--2,6-diaminopimelate ligase [Bacillus spongiae]|uniref:UDP-N-acetylmuramoyl-L-alanyl-D-glutamate--2,6-diaminopimelate ligase n=1 Tax=Bacillus spongiae TaxID=2683610 RepID=A0ABU8HEL7_9BACI
MKLKQIADLFMVKRTIGNMEIKIKGIQMDSRKIEKGDLFICVPAIEGFLEDRHLYAADAVKKGAVALIVERDVPIDVPKIVVKDARKAMAMIASHYYDHPSKAMRLIGITGTNGKTTTSYIIEKILADNDFKTGLMGNTGVKINHNWYSTDINTQEPPTLQKNLRTMKECQTDYCMMEVTSQGLDMGRVSGCHFRTAVFTNLTQDHLDYHGTVEKYRETKGLFFSRLGHTYQPNESKFAVLNADDPSFDFFKKQTTVEIITYGIDNEADVMAKDIVMTLNGVEFKLVSFKGEIEISLQIVGRFNVYNALAGIAAALIEDISLENIRDSLYDMRPIGGRMEAVDEGQDFLVLVDYAHTPDALENVLQSISEFCQRNIITVFGCGGDRDVSKRPLMGEIAGNYSDVVIVTSDNPRTEDPEKIVRDIEKGIAKSNVTNYQLVVNREDAIQQAISMAAPNDVILIAGKGSETYQLINGTKFPFDDRDVARKSIGFSMVMN